MESLPWSSPSLEAASSRDWAPLATPEAASATLEAAESAVPRRELSVAEMLAETPSASSAVDSRVSARLPRLPRTSFS